jgi:hypothetical protein
MVKLAFFLKQFLLTKCTNFDLQWGCEKILNYNLFYHPELEFEHIVNKKT